MPELGHRTRRALLSVSDKEGLVSFAKGLLDRGFDLVSTGGTAEALRAHGLPVVEVADITGHPEMLGGRVKTLHPAIHSGVLWRRERTDDREEMALLGYSSIDVVAVNLYPFAETAAEAATGVPTEVVSGAGAEAATGAAEGAPATTNGGRNITPREVLEQIDVGGPTLLRAAAKTCEHVWAVPGPEHYDTVLSSLDLNDLEAARAMRKTLAAATFAKLSAYDAHIACYLKSSTGPGGVDPELSRSGTPESEAGTPESEVDHALPTAIAPRFVLEQTLRYGENPGQKAAFYLEAASNQGAEGCRPPSYQQLHGKELSYNNLLDLDGALFSLSPFAGSSYVAACIVKHATPCGMAMADSVSEAFSMALATDQESAFGSVVAVSGMVDEASARLMSTIFIECVCAEGFSDKALELLTKKKNLRVLVRTNPSMCDARWSSGSEQRAIRVASGGLQLRSVLGGILAQEPHRPPSLEGPAGWEVITKRSPTSDEELDLRFAWAAAFGVKSNAIVIAKDGATLGIGGGQTSRVEATRAAVGRARRAGLDLTGAVLASDGFFPFRDGVDAAAALGVRAIIQPGGSIRDDEVRAAADEHNMCMVVTGRRLFRH